MRDQLFERSLAILANRGRRRDRRATHQRVIARHELIAAIQPFDERAPAFLALRQLDVIFHLAVAGDVAMEEWQFRLGYLKHSQFEVANLRRRGFRLGLFLVVDAHEDANGTVSQDFHGGRAPAPWPRGWHEQCRLG